MENPLRIEGDRWISIPLSFIAITGESHDCWKSGWRWKDRETINRQANPTAASILELLRYWTQCRIKTYGPGEHWLHESISTFSQNLYGIATSPKTIRKAIQLLEDRGYISIRRSEDSAHDFRLNWEKVREDAANFLSKEEKRGSLPAEVKATHPESNLDGFFPESEEADEADFFSVSADTIGGAKATKKEGGDNRSEGEGKSAYKYKSLVNTQKSFISSPTQPPKTFSEVEGEQSKPLTPTPPSGGFARTEATQGGESASDSATPKGQGGFGKPERPFRNSYEAAGIKSPVERFEERLQGKAKREYFWKGQGGEIQFDPKLLSVWVSEDPESWVGEDGVVALGRLIGNLSHRVRTHEFERMDATWEAVKLREQMGLAFPSVRQLWVQKSSKPAARKPSAPSTPSFGTKSAPCSRDEVLAMFAQKRAEKDARKQASAPSYAV